MQRHRIPKPVKVMPTLGENRNRQDYANKASIEELNQEMGISDDEDVEDLKRTVFTNKKKTKEISYRRNSKCKDYIQ